jgi:hypothetical protein
VALCDRDRGRAAEAAQKFAIPKIYYLQQIPISCNAKCG